MRKDQVWAVPAEEIRAFFRLQPHGAETEEGFRFGSCLVAVTALPPAGEGFWRKPQTRIVMEGPEQELAEIYGRFFLRFLSAGG